MKIQFCKVPAQGQKFSFFFAHIAVRTISECSHANGFDMCWCTDERAVHIIPLHILVCVN